VTLLNKDQSTRSVVAFAMLRLRPRFQRSRSNLNRYPGPRPFDFLVRPHLSRHRFSLTGLYSRANIFYGSAESTRHYEPPAGDAPNSFKIKFFLGSAIQPLWNLYLKHSFAPRRILTSVFSHSCGLFCTHQKFNSFLFNLFRTLWQKHRGWGAPHLQILQVQF
jgi:hypothetical protein